ncbi:MAG: MucR family transcriptional regulator [Inquilinaceae bacterium]
MDLSKLTADIVGAYVAKHDVPAESLPALIKSVYDSLAKLASPEAEPEAELQPAVPIKKSITPDFLVCLEDGKKLKMLKRHLSATYGMTPDDYRVKWGLPATYPMVAPNYAAQRSALAKKIGLGSKGKGAGKKSNGDRRNSKKAAA